MKKLVLNIILINLGLFLFGQDEITSRRTLLWGSTAHIGNGKLIPNAAIGIEDNGTISFVADAEIIRIDTSSFNVIHLEGKHIYPGIIALNTQVGLKEIDQVRQTHDFNEIGQFNAGARSLTSYNSDSWIIPTLKANGILFIQSCPLGGLVAGKSSVFQLDGWNWEDAVVRKDDGIHVFWPKRYNYDHYLWNRKRGKTNKKWDKDVTAIYDYFEQAKAYLEQDQIKAPNINFDALKKIFLQKENVYVHAQTADEILSSLLFIEHFKVNGVIVGGHDAWLVKKQLSEAQVPLVLDQVHRLPDNEDDPIDIAYSLPKILLNENILFAIAGEKSWQQRNLAFHAGSTVPYGLTKEQALSAITINPAKILGIDHRLGSLEEGKDASLVISEGDILDPVTNKIIKAMIKGKFISLDNPQENLYLKYLNKYGLE